LIRKLKIMKNKIVCLIATIVIAFLFIEKSYAQTLSGTVFEMDAKNTRNSLTGVNIYWLGTTKGTTSDANGNFEISRKGITNSNLVFSFLGYKTDTILIAPGKNDLQVAMAPGPTNLNEVVIKNEDNGSYNSRTNLRKVQIITTGELQRAACCNLAESFETNASVDVAYSDAITGAKQIQLLGLSGLYSQIISENVPLVHGLASSFGLNYIPGSWMESIQVSKGTSSVINGYESTTGQINVEFKKPATSEKLFVNLFANSNGRLEANANASHKFNTKLSTMILGHVDDFRSAVDKNNDLFMDVPKVKTVNLFNRWDYMVPNKYVSRFGIKYLSEERDGGYLNYSKDSYTEDTTGITDRTKSYGTSITTKRTEVFWKNGLMFPNKPYKSLALIVSGINLDQTGSFGLNAYSGKEKSFFSSLLYQSMIGNKNHKYTTGLSYSNSDYKEAYDRTNLTYLYQITGNTADLFKLVDYSKMLYNMNRAESVYGAFFEYTLHYREILSVIAGVRADHHNQFGTFITPRLNIKYNINETLTLRGSAGKGYRTANVFAENYSLMASQRLINFVEPLKQEEAWNFGLNLNKQFKLFGNKAEIDMEGYRTNFINQVIVDMDSLPQTAFFYNLHGKSYSNCLQVQLTVEPIKHFSVLLALRSNDVKTTIGGKLRDKPFVSTFKGLATLQYSTKFEIWKFDLTGQLNGPARIPDTQKMPAALIRDSHSPTFFNLLAQVTKKYKHFDVYLGGENLTNFTQKDPITEGFAPYHTHFDTSMVWGPLVGITVYAGIRFTIK
jgi:outer membrane receptor for ferrienterochelin and colicins